MKKLGFGFLRPPLLNKNDSMSFDKEQLCKMVDIFLERGFTYFDTAYAYHRSKNEELLREVLVERHPRDRFTVATKLPTAFLKKEEDLERIFAEQVIVMEPVKGGTLANVPPAAEKRMKEYHPDYSVPS